MDLVKVLVTLVVAVLNMFKIIDVDISSDE